MGITNLLPLMKNATAQTKLGSLKDTVAVVDTNGWVHRACFACGDKVYLGEETTVYIDYCIKMCDLLKKHNITPILVFDGQSLPAKAETKKKRQARKNEVRAEIERLLAAGKTREARGLMRTAVDVTFEMCRKVMLRCREEGIDYILAPFEADAQMVYMVNAGIADYAITEDSDLLVFGCKKILTKLDRESGVGQMITLSKMDKCFPGYNHLTFQYLCIFSGCDYLSNIANFGMGRARKFCDTLKIGKFDMDDIPRMIKTIPNVVKVPKMGEITDDYIEGFIRAYLAFTHQLVYCPIRKIMTHLKPLRSPDHHEALKLGEFAGEFFENQSQEFLNNYVLGNIHCKSLEQLECHDGDIEFSKTVQKRIKNSTGLITSSVMTITSKVETIEISGDEEETVPESPLKSKNTKTVATKGKHSRTTKKTEIKAEEKKMIVESPVKNGTKRNIFSKTVVSQTKTETKEEYDENSVAPESPVKGTKRNVSSTTIVSQAKRSKVEMNSDGVKKEEIEEFKSVIVSKSGYTRKNMEKNVKTVTGNSKVATRSRYFRSGSIDSNGSSQASLAP